MDSLEEIKRLHARMIEAVQTGGDALGAVPGGQDRAKGYVRAVLDAAVCVFTERADDGRPVSYQLVRAYLRDDMSAEEVLRRHARGDDAAL